MLIYEYLPNKGNFNFVLCPAIPQVTILNVASQLSCSGLLWSTSSLPLAQAIYKLKQIYIRNLATKNQLQIILSTYTQREKKKKRVAGGSPEADIAHEKASGAPFCCLKTVSVHWLDWPTSLLLGQQTRHSAPDLQQKQDSEQNIYMGQGFSNYCQVAWPKCLTIPTSLSYQEVVKDPIETLYNPRFCLSNLGT